MYLRIKNIIKANQRAIEAARQHRIPVIFIRLVLDKHFNDVSSSNKVFSTIKAQGYAITEADASTRILEDLAPLEDEPIILSDALAHLQVVTWKFIYVQMILII